MTDEYQNLINKKIIEDYEQALIIDIDSDKIYKYENNNGRFIQKSISSYSDYCNNCDKYIYTDDIEKYIEALSISKLTQNNGKNSLNYKMFNDTLGSYLDYSSNISLYSDNGKNIIVVLNSRSNDNNKIEDNTNREVQDKMMKLIDSVSMAMLKIHNIVNNYSNLETQDEYINSVLVSLTKEFPELNKSFNDNAIDAYSNVKESILIIDDDNMTCNIIGKVFNDDYDILFAHNGQEAIDTIKNSKNINISCIFLDLVMPVLDGFKVLDYLRNNNLLTKLPVIIISGNYDKETRNRAYNYQIADMLEKPFSAQVIKHRIENLINLYRSSGILNKMMLEQHEELKNIINSIVISYNMDNKKTINMIQKYMKVLTTQVSFQFPEYHIDSNMIERIALSSGYYMIGNYILPKSILYKKSELTEEEKDIVKLSIDNGLSIIKYVIASNDGEVDSRYCYEIAKYYTENYDGSGYYEKLKGDSIPLVAQIASLVIEYYNLTNSINPIDYEKIASLIIMESGHKFNPKIVEAFKIVKPELERITKMGE